MLLGFSKRALADTSELSLGLESGAVWRLTHQQRSSSRGDLRWENRGSSWPMIDEFELNGKVGLGVSFSTTLWLRGGYERAQEDSYLIAKSTQCDHTLGVKPPALCSRIRAIGFEDRWSALFGGSYRPRDGSTLVLQLGAGFTYLPALNMREVIEVGAEEVWTRKLQGDLIKTADSWRLRSYLSIGWDLRLLSRWGLQWNIWLRGEGLSAWNQMTLGSSLSLSRYRYIRLF